MRVRQLALLILTLAWTAAPAVFPQPADSAAPVAVRAVHERLQELDRELRHRLELTARNFDRSRAQDLRREAEGLRRRLGELERQLAGFEDEAARALRRKLRALESLVANLERAASQAAPAAALPRDPERRAYTVPRRRGAAPGHDACAGALPIAVGDEVSGTTAGAGQDGAASCGVSHTSPDVWYKLTATTFGYVSLDTFGSGYDTVVSVHTSCPGTPANQLVCNDDAFGVQSATSFYAATGQDYWIRVSGFGGASGPFQLRLGTGGEVAGTVTAAADGAPLADGQVAIYDGNGYLTRYATTDAAGDYSVALSIAGTYFLKTDSFSGYLDELYDDVPCPDGAPSGCSVTDGQAIEVRSLGSVTGLDFALDRGGTLAGELTQATSGDPAVGVGVYIFDAEGSFVFTALTDAAGGYEVAGLASGTYYAATQSAAYANELYDDFPCPGGAPYGCEPTTGTAIAVTAPQTTAGIDFALDRLGILSGGVTEAATGDPIPGVQMTFFDATTGYDVAYAYTDETGAYSTGGLPAGSYFVVATHPGYAGEVYDDVPCSGPYYWSCDLTSGTPVAVALNAETSGIDFALNRYGSVSGTVTQALTGDPVVNVRVEIWDADGNLRDWSYSDFSGSYSFSQLRPGNHFVATNLRGDLIDELYDDIACPHGPPVGCDPLTGDPVAVALDATITGIDFALDPGGSISGTVTATATGDPIPSATVRIWDASGALARSGNTDFSGTYSLAGLPAGNYFVTSTAYEFTGELWDDLPCPDGVSPGCDPTTGTAVAVTLNAETAGIDFALDRLGAISGTVVEAATGEPISSASVGVWNSSGSSVQYGYTDPSGAYTITGLASGTYFVVAEGDYSSSYLAQLYSGLPCPASCDPTTGTPVAVAANATTSGIDFALDRLGSIAGTVTDVDGKPLPNIDVRALSADGSIERFGYTDSTGSYRIAGLAPGSFYLWTQNYDGYVDEIHDDLPCLGTCDPRKGTPVNVALALTTQVDFVLGYFAITGTVTQAGTGAPLAGLRVHAWTSTSYYEIGEDTTDALGRYRLRLAPGSYYVSTDNDLGYVDEVYAGRLCPDGSVYDRRCDAASGTLVHVGVSGQGAIAGGIDFDLTDDVAIFSDGFESGDLTSWSSSLP